MTDAVKNGPYIADRDLYKNKKEFSTDFDQDAFMKLLIEQLKNQDPMSPMDNSQFVQQTSMMAMVERLTNIQKLMEESNSSLLNIREYEQLVGRTVSYQVPADDGGKVSVDKKGTISAVLMQDGKIYFRIGDDLVPRDKVKGIESKGMSNDTLLENTLKYSEMIGKAITYKEGRTVDADGNPDTKDDITTVYESKNAVITGLNLKDGKLTFQLDNGKTIALEDMSGLTVQPDNVPVDNTLKYTQMVGYQVTYLEPVVASDGTTTNEEKTATISAVSMKNGLIEFVLDNDKRLKPNEIIGVATQSK